MNPPANTTDPDVILWEAILRRDPRFDGFLYYGVTSTGIFCKPTCPSPRPKRSNVYLFSEADDAHAAGFRPCLRCKPLVINDPEGDVARVQDAVRFIESHDGATPSLRALGDHVGLSPDHFQKVFKSTLGVSPQQYATALRMARFKREVRSGESIAGAAIDAGFASPSRLYEKAGERLGMTPGRYKQQGKGLTIRHMERKTALGWLLIAATDQGLCSVQLGDNRKALVALLHEEFAQADLVAEEGDLVPWMDAFVDYLNGNARLPEFPLDVQATAFQAKVWQALRNIPHGTTLSYSELAQAVGDPNASRAVASACARNPVALTIPCHRIVPKTGGFGGYRWDPARKKRLLEIERMG